MNALVPSRTKASPVSTAVVRIAAASEPEPGSVRPQAPEHLAPRERRQVALALRAACRKRQMWFVQSELCAHIVMPTDPSARDSSSTTRA